MTDERWCSDETDVAVLDAPSSVKVYMNPQTGQTGNPGTKEKPVATFKEALDLVGPGGGTIYLEGVIEKYEQKIKIQGRYYPANSPLIIDGQRKTISKQQVAVLNSQNVIIKSIEMHGGIELKGETMDYATTLANVMFYDCVVRYGRLFAGGYSYRNITLYRCTVQEIIYDKNVTHGVYFSGGHWSEGAHLPCPSGINIVNCVLRFCGGRHGIQLNGRFKDAKILGNMIYCTAMAAYQGIGVQGCEVAYNTFFAENRWNLSIYDYWDQWGWTGDPGYSAWWKTFHQPNRNWYVHHNTFLQGPKSWGNWWAPSIPDNRGSILINNSVHGAKLPDGSTMDYAPMNLIFMDNVIASPWPVMFEYHDPYSAWVSTVRHNLFHTYKAGAEPLVCFASDVPIEPKAFTIPWLEENRGEFFGANIVGVDPEFKQFPEYPDASQIPPFPNYDWSQWPGKFDFFSEIAEKLKIGSPHEYIWARGKIIEAKKHMTPEKLAGVPEFDAPSVSPVELADMGV